MERLWKMENYSNDSRNTCNHSMAIEVGNDANMNRMNFIKNTELTNYGEVRIMGIMVRYAIMVRNIDVLMNIQSPNKWWSTLKSAVFGSSSSLPPLVGPGRGLVCESVDKADLLSDHFDSKPSREAVDLLVTCHPSPS